MKKDKTSFKPFIFKMVYNIAYYFPSYLIFALVLEQYCKIPIWDSLLGFILLAWYNAYHKYCIDDLENSVDDLEVEILSLKELINDINYNIEKQITGD